MKVGFVQIDCRFGEKEKNIQRAAEMISRQPADLWVLPELFNTGYQFVSKREAADLAEPVPAGPTTEKLISLAKEHQTHLVAGLAERHGKVVYNASVLVGPKGFISVYRKIHLFYEEKRWFTPGNLPFQVDSISLPRAGKVGIGNVRVGNVRVGMMICFDWVFPEAARSLALLGADLIAHPSNLVLPYCPDAMPTRCIENRIFSVTANRVGTESRGRGAGGKETLTFIGQSEIVDPKGKILHRASDRKEEASVVEIDPKLARNKSLNRYNHLFKDRRERFYTKAGSGVSTK